MGIGSFTPGHQKTGSPRTPRRILGAVVTRTILAGKKRCGRKMPSHRAEENCNCPPRMRVGSRLPSYPGRPRLVQRRGESQRQRTNQQRLSTGRKTRNAPRSAALLGRPGSASGPPWERFWGALGALLGHPGSASGPPWERFWAALGAHLDRPGSASGAPWERFWAALGALLGRPGSASARSRHTVVCALRFQVPAR